MNTKKRLQNAVSFLRSRYKAIDRQHKAEAEEHAVGRKAAAAADVCLRHHVVNDDIQHRSGCKGERKRQYAARERYGKVAEKYTGHLDRTAYKRDYRRALFARSGFQQALQCDTESEICTLKRVSDETPQVSDTQSVSICRFVLSK